MGAGVGVVGSGRLELERAFKPLGRTGIAGGPLVNQCHERRADQDQACIKVHVDENVNENEGTRSYSLSSAATRWATPLTSTRGVGSSGRQRLAKPPAYYDSLLWEYAEEPRKTGCPSA